MILSIQNRYLKNEREKKLENDKKIKASRHLVQLSIWRGELEILNMNTY